MSNSSYFKKDPQAKLPFTVDWVDWLPTGETITSVTWTFPSGITKASQSNTTTAATALVSGGTVDTEYSIICHIVTAPSGYEDERTITIKVENR